MQDLASYTNATNVLFPDGLAWAVAAESKLYRLCTQKFGVKGATVLWRPNLTAANGSRKWDTSQTFAAGPTPLEARFAFARDYVGCVIDTEADMATESAGGFDGASETILEATTKAAVKEHALSVRSTLIGTGKGGARAQILSGYNTATITLVNPESAALFLQNMWVQAASDTGDAAVPAGLRDGGAAVQIVAPRVRAGTLTTSDGSAWNTLIPNLANGDYLFRRDDYGLAWNGLLSHFPSTAPTAGDSFGGLDRSINPDKLAGLVVDGLPGNNIVQALFNIREALQANLGADDDAATMQLTAVMSNRQVANLMNSVQSQVRYTPGAGEAKLGASDFMIATPWGAINVVGEAGFPQKSILMGDLKAFNMHVRQKEMPMWFQGDGRIWRHTATKGDSIEAYMHSHVATTCDYPSRFAHGVLP